MAELTIQDLAAKVDTLEKAVAQHAETIGSQAKTIDAQGKLIKALQKENGALKEAAKEADAPAPAAPTVPDQAFEVNGKKYKFVLAKFIYNKEEVTALDALGNEALLTELVEKGSGLIKEVA